MIKAILIGGTSHAGKSTLARSVAEVLRWPLMSTDKLARHPGRPWPTVPVHVAEYYLKLSDEAIYEFLMAHHMNMWPGVRDLIGRCLQEAAPPLVLEGSALRPEFVAELQSEEIVAIWLIGTEACIRERILRDSDYAGRAPQSRVMIDKFLTRSLTDNRRIDEIARRMSLLTMDSQASDLLDRVKARLAGSDGLPRTRQLLD